MRSVTLCILLFFPVGAQETRLGEAVRIERVAGGTLDRRAAVQLAIPATWYDTSSRHAVAQGYINDYLPTRAIPSGWNGNVAAGVAGTTAQPYRDAVAQRINWFRAMAGVPAWITLDPVLNMKAQYGALMLAANRALSHTPPTTWTLYTPEGAEALGSSNICQGLQADPACIEQYMADQGLNNAAAGHRRWILFPQTRFMGTGDVPHEGNLWNALWVLPDSAAWASGRPATRDEFVAWPPAGYVPYQVVFPRWSFSYPGADFSNATITMIRSGVAAPLRIEAPQAGIGENSTVWIPDNRDVTGWPTVEPPATDTTWNITISNVRVSNQTRSFTYQVIVFDPGAGNVYTPDPPVSSFAATGGNGSIWVFRDPPTAPATAVSSAPWIHDIRTGAGSAGTFFVVYTVSPNPGAARTGIITVGNAFHIVNQAGTAVPAMSLNRSQVRFGVVAGEPAKATGPQEVQVTFTGAGAAGATWAVSSNQPWLSATPAGGTGSGKFTLSLNTNALPGAGSYTAIVTVTPALGDPQIITAPLAVMTAGSTTGPIGVVDTPQNGLSNISGATNVTGWALDDTEVVRISVWRNPISGEPVHSNGHVFIGDAVFLEGARPDVFNIYGNYPMNTRAGWGLQVLTNMLPNTGGQPGRGNGLYHLFIYAHDREGNVKLLGSPGISVNNAQSTRPFGTIDTPGNGSNISGTVVNFGWALTPQPAIIPPDGSTIWVFLDGVPVGRPVYNNMRPDIATLFPGYANASGAVGYFIFDTTQLADGMHRIAWSVTDNLGRTEGIGSRVFWIRNSVAAPSGRGNMILRQSKSGPAPTRRAGDLLYRTGYDLGVELVPFEDNTEIEVEQGGRVELHVAAGTAIAFNGSHALPAGSTFDAASGVFYWQIDPIYNARYDLTFHTRSGEPRRGRIRVVPRKR